MTIIEGVAIYGAVIATLTLFWRSIDFFRHRRKAKLTFATEIEGNHREKKIWITVMNVGSRPIYLAGAGFLMYRGRRWAGYLMTKSSVIVPNPPVLNDGESYTFILDVEECKERLKKLQKEWQGATIKCAFVEDQTDRLYKEKVPPDILNLLL